MTTITAISPDCMPTIPGGSGPRRIHATTEELIAQALRDIGRARGCSTGWGVRVLSECVGFDLRRAYQAYLCIGPDGWIFHGSVHTSYTPAAEQMAWVVLRLREWQFGAALPGWDAP